MNKRKLLILFFIIFIMIFGVTYNSYATNVEDINSITEEPAQTQSDVDKYKKVLDIQKKENYSKITPSSKKMPRTGIEENPLLFVANVCFSSATVGIVVTAIYSVVRKNKQ